MTPLNLKNLLLQGQIPKGLYLYLNKKYHYNALDQIFTSPSYATLAVSVSASVKTKNQKYL